MAAVIPPSSAWLPHAHDTLASAATRSHASSFTQAVSSSRHPSPDHSERADDRPKKLKPYLRKISRRDSTNALDLSRPAAENQSLAGLGYYNEESRSAADINFTSSSQQFKSGHTRNASNTSNYSSTSIGGGPQRPSVPYSPTFRHTPRPYTPPIARANTAALTDSTTYEEQDDIMSDEDFRPRHPRTFDSGHHSRRSGSIGSLPTVPQSAHMLHHSSSSLTRLNGPATGTSTSHTTHNHSQSSLPSMAGAAGRPRGDTLRSIDTSSGSGRPSLDKAMSFIRGATSSRDDLRDPASRQAHIHAARIAYAEREEAKERKAERELARQHERAARKKSSPNNQYSGRRSNGSAGTSMAEHSHSEKMTFMTKSYGEYASAAPGASPLHSPLPASVAATKFERTARREAREGRGQRKGIKARWLGFLAWFRTRLLRIGLR